MKYVKRVKPCRT